MKFQDEASSTIAWIGLSLQIHSLSLSLLSSGPREGWPVSGVAVGSSVLWFLIGFGQWEASAENQRAREE